MLSWESSQPKAEPEGVLREGTAQEQMNEVVVGTVS